MEALEVRQLPSVAASPPVPLGRAQGAAAQPLAPIAASGPSAAVSLVNSPVWAPSNSRAFATSVPAQLLEESYFNSPQTYRFYRSYFHGVLQQWVAQADQQGITDNNGLVQFLGARMQTYFGQTRKHLATFYPGQTLETYQLLMAMNLAHGYFTYDTIPKADRSYDEILHLQAGDCVEIAQLLTILLHAEGVAARDLGLVDNFETNLGQFVSGHVLVNAGGLWLDAETNTAYALSLQQIERVPPAERLQTLFDAGRVFGFYNWYLQPQVRQKDVAIGQDGGIVAFYYQYYLEGIGQGNTKVYYLPAY